jgi:hypothetical protein
MSWLDFALGSLATYYLALSVARQEGPFRAFERMRNVFTADDWKGRGIRCHVCVSLYAALLIALALWGLGKVDGWNALLVWPGLAGASVMLEKYWLR